MIMKLGCCTCYWTPIKTCYVCEKEITDDTIPRVQCVRCKIYMHTDCYDKEKDTTLPYTKCAACSRTGTIGMEMKQLKR